VNEVTSQFQMACRRAEAFLRCGLDQGCPLEQILNFARARLVLHPRQLMASAAARRCDSAGGPTYVGYGGARGGGKSYWLLAQIGADDCQRLPGLKCLLLRKVGKANLENFEDLRARLFRWLPHEFAAHRGVLTFANGSRIVAGHFQNERDIDSYLGLEYDVIAIEEATTLTARKHQDIITCCRSSKTLPNGEPWRPRIYSTTNPGGVGHGWYRSMYVEPCRNGVETETRFIPARVTDNVFIDRDYASRLSQMPGWQKRAWYDGDWDIAAGQFFTKFSRDVHVIDEFNPRRAREWTAAFDYGFSHYTVALLGCTDGDDNFFIMDEHAARQWLPQQHAEAIVNMCGRHGLKVYNLRRFVAGSDVFSPGYDGRTIAEQYSDLGIHFSQANTERIHGWAEILRRLGDPQSRIRPKLFIHRRCKRLIDCLPLLQHDPDRPEDVLKMDVDDEGNGGDDAADALRYLVATRAPKIYVRHLTGL